LSFMNSTSSSVKVMTGSSLVYFIFLRVSSTYAVFLFVCEGCAPLYVACTLSLPSWDVSLFLASC
jgi:hypothetical protein